MQLRQTALTDSYKMGTVQCHIAAAQWHYLLWYVYPLPGRFIAFHLHIGSSWTRRKQVACHVDQTVSSQGITENASAGIIKTIALEHQLLQRFACCFEMQVGTLRTGLAAKQGHCKQVSHGCCRHPLHCSRSFSVPSVTELIWLAVGKFAGT